MIKRFFYIFSATLFIMISASSGVNAVVLEKKMKALERQLKSPPGFSYQAALRNNDGTPLASTDVDVRFTILDESGTELWIETHDLTTDQFGLITTTIGEGTKISGSVNFFGDLDWGAFYASLKVEVDSGSGFVDLGTTELQSVPYARYATNGLTSDERTKLTNITAGAEVNVQSDWNQTDTNADDFIKNKPANLDTDATDDFSGDYNDLTNKPTIPADIDDLADGSGNAALNGVFTANELAVAGAFNLPTSDGTNGQVLTTDGGGVVTWETPPGGGSYLGAGDYSFQAGYNNTADADYSVIGGGRDNVISAGDGVTTFDAYEAVISGGLGNSIAVGAFRSLIAGGQDNQILADADRAVIGGGGLNYVRTGSYNTIAGGQGNEIGTVGYNTYYVSIGGGKNNKIEYNASYSTISGGEYHTIEHSDYATISGGSSNNIDYSDKCSIGGGDGNYINQSEAGTISGGYGNNIGDSYNGTIGGGYQNELDDAKGSFIGGGKNNVARYSGQNVAYVTIGGGYGNRVYNALYSTVAGGKNGFIDANYATIGGGYYAYIIGDNSTVGGGYNNWIYTSNATIGGGIDNIIQSSSDYSTISGGDNNLIETSSANSTIGGGKNNTSYSSTSVISGGYGNTINTGSSNTVIAGGSNNSIGSSSAGAVLAGGVNNIISGNSGNAFIGGGFNNTISAPGAAAIGGVRLSTSSYMTAVVGSQNATTGGSNSSWVATDPIFIIGNGDVTLGAGSTSDAMVVLKNGNTDINGTLVANSLGVDGEFTLPTADGMMDYVMQTNGSGTVTWVDPAGFSSDNRLKTDLRDLTNVMESLRKIDGYRFKWNNVQNRNQETDQIGFMAQEIQKIYPELVSVDSHGYLKVKYISFIPILLEGIKHLDEQNQLLIAENAALKTSQKLDEARFSNLENQVAYLVQLITQTENVAKK